MKRNSSAIIIQLSIRGNPRHFGLHSLKFSHSPLREILGDSMVSRIQVAIGVRYRDTVNLFPVGPVLLKSSTAFVMIHMS
jgi:hypothetical protein